MILQFGTSRFLQAHVDLFAWEARCSGQSVGDIVIVQVSKDAERARRLDAFSDPAGFPVIVRGLDAGLPVERSIQVRSVTRGLAAARDWDELRRLFIEDAGYVVSNTGDNGFAISDADRLKAQDDVAPSGYCAMLVSLLHQRWRAGRPGVTCLPCELLASNGTVLRGIVVGLAREQGLEPAFLRWLETQCLWVNTLVDRIVSEPLAPAGAVAEPYALWAVEDQPGLRLPFTHPALVLTGDLAPYERLKLHILNLGHSWLAEAWHVAGAAPMATVREAMETPEILAGLQDLYAQEVVAGFAAHGLEDAARAYVATTLERFANPFLDHRLGDIFSNHAAKIDKRIARFIVWVDASGNRLAMPRLRALAARYRDVS
ncbi:MAG: mannitol dehydrogenase family protein [Sphingomonadales bacterium]|nr:mannitol dehydrogenase family protein [Sphingomonadales bacterium]MDE2170282.1 mannitol dehydrogenase family protein [Sphingomonadales bacterium]